jgi:hypothetical protein
LAGGQDGEQDRRNDVNAVGRLSHDSPLFSCQEVELHDDALTESLGLATLHQLRADGTLHVAPRHLVTNRQITHRTIQAAHCRMPAG